MPSVAAISSTVALRRRSRKPNRCSNRFFRSGSRLDNRRECFLRLVFFIATGDMALANRCAYRGCAEAIAGRRIHWKSQRQCRPGSINFLVLFRQTDNRKIVQAPVAAFTAGDESWPFPPSTMIRSGKQDCHKNFHHSERSAASRGIPRR